MIENNRQDLPWRMDTFKFCLTNSLFNWMQPEGISRIRLLTCHYENIIMFYHICSNIQLTHQLNKISFQLYPLLLFLPHLLSLLYIFFLHRFLGFSNNIILKLSFNKNLKNEGFHRRIWYTFLMSSNSNRMVSMLKLDLHFNDNGVWYATLIVDYDM